MRTLTNEEILKLATRKGVKTMAVQNFLGTMGEDASTAMYNVQADARSYKWNAATQKAIRDGISLARK